MKSIHQNNHLKWSIFHCRLRRLTLRWHSRNLGRLIINVLGVVYRPPAFWTHQLKLHQFKVFNDSSDRSSSDYGYWDYYQWFLDRRKESTTGHLVNLSQKTFLFFPQKLTSHKWAPVRGHKMLIWMNTIIPVLYLVCKKTPF